MSKICNQLYKFYCVESTDITIRLPGIAFGTSVYEIDNGITQPHKENWKG